MKISKLISSFAVLAFVSACGARPEPTKSSELTQDERDHLTVARMKVSELESADPVDLDSLSFAETNLTTNKEGEDIEVLLDRVINIGQKIWKIVENGKPILNEQLESANALPEGITNWKQLENWQTPVGRTYQVSYENLFGMEVVRFNFRLVYTYGGSYKGKGQYLTHVAVLPADVHVAWGYHLNAEAGVPSVTNSGTVDDPRAGAQIDVRWKVKTILKEGDYSASYFVRGDGAFTDLN